MSWVGLKVFNLSITLHLIDRVNPFTTRPVYDRFKRSNIHSFVSILTFLTENIFNGLYTCYSVSKLVTMLSFLLNRPSGI